MFGTPKVNEDHLPASPSHGVTRGGNENSDTTSGGGRGGAVFTGDSTASSHVDLATRGTAAGQGASPMVSLSMPMVVPQTIQLFVAILQRETMISGWYTSVGQTHILRLRLDIARLGM